MNMKEEMKGAVEFTEINDNGSIEIPDTMWHNINRYIPEKQQLEGFLCIETLGNDTYRIKKLVQDDMPMTRINIPDVLKNQIHFHINDDAIRREFEYTSIEDFIYRSIKETLTSERDMCYIDR